LHFGMTGDLLYYKQDTSKPKVYILLIKFENGNNLLFSDWRKFGMIALTESPYDFMAKRKYGKDALLITLEEFIDTFKKLKTSIKTALIDQHHVAGVGNEFSDEILFQATIHPESKANKLRYEILEEIYNQMQKILKEAVFQNADRKKLKHYFFLGNRKEGLTCPRCGGETSIKTIGGRSSYFCPTCQKLIQ
jgi:formamidopyrimidine-DNA glycosylase